MDPLSEVLSLLKPRSYAFRGLDAGEDWAIDFPAGKGLKCYAITSGQCWLWLADDAPPVHFATGDVVMLARGQAFRMGSRLDAPAVDAVTLFNAVPEGEVALVGRGGCCKGVGGYFIVDATHMELLIGLLPPVVHFRGDSEKTALRGSVEQLMLEMRHPQPGGSLIAEHLAQTLLIQALRLHLAERPSGRAGARAGYLRWGTGRCAPLSGRCTPNLDAAGPSKP